MDSRQSYLVRLFVIIVGLIGALIVINEATQTDYPVITGSEPVTDTTLTAGYEALYETIFERDATLLKPFLDHTSLQVRTQAWRAFANTPVEADSLRVFIEKAMEHNSDAAWFGISKHELSAGRLRMLERRWEEDESLRSGISLVLGQQGDRETLDFLFSKFPESMGASYERNFSLAVGRLALRHELTASQKLQVIRQAFESSDVQVTRGYLYGFYRGSQRTMEPVVQDSLYQHWRVYGVGVRPEIDQYAARIIPQKALHEIAIYYNGENKLEGRVQLAVELAQVLAQVELNDRGLLDARLLLTHPNPHVVRQVLASLSGRIGPGEDLYAFIRDQILQPAETADAAWLQALETLSLGSPELINEHQGRLEQIGDRNPYLLRDALSLLRQRESHGEFLDRLEGYLDSGNTLKAMFAVQELNEFADSFGQVPNPNERLKQIVERVRSLTFRALSLHDRGVAYAAQSLLLNKKFFTGEDFGRINRSLSQFRLPADIEVYQAFGRLYKERFEEQAAPVIDSLAALGYIPLNRSLAQAGWDIEIPEVSETDFRRPDWERLWNGIGHNALWVLVMDEGPVKVRLDLLNAPATISAIDSLTRAGAYDGVPFHRVVPNFVIQGGDIERADGFGGPDFVLPTEGSEIPFSRGKIGIASAGTDTEGSQYFIMHMWSPHLNGNYTVFGEVVEGMNIVDRVAVGDTVRTAYWE